MTLVLSSWYWIPLVISYASGHTEVVADLYHPNALAGDPLQILTAEAISSMCYASSA